MCKMFSTFKILVIYSYLYLIIPRCTNGGGIEITLNSGELVEKELAPIEKNLEMIADVQTSNDKKLELKGEVRGALRKIIERAVKADELLKNQGCLEKEKIEEGRYREVLVVRTRIEYLEDLLFNKFDANPTSRKSRWQIILRENNPKPSAKAFRKRVLNKYSSVADPQNAIDKFCNAIQHIYHDLSSGDRAPHNLVDPVVLEKLRKDDLEAKLLLRTLSVQDEPSYISALQLIAEHVDSPSEENKDFTIPFEVPLSRIDIYPKYGNFQNVKEADVKKFFHGIDSVKDAKINILTQIITVDFANQKDAWAALNVCTNYLMLQNPLPKQKKFIEVMYNLNYRPIEKENTRFQSNDMQKKN